MFSTRPVAVEHVEVSGVLFLAGEVDLAVESEILDACERLIGAKPAPRVVVDVSGVTFLDSSGLRVLATAQERAGAQGGSVCVAGASERIARLFRIVQMDAMLATPPPALARERHRPGDHRH